MSREDAIDDLIARLAAASGDAAELGLDGAVYLLKLAMLEMIERATVKADSDCHRPMLAGLA
jgi:hypothetical protein